MIKRDIITCEGQDILNIINKYIQPSLNSINEYETIVEEKKKLKKETTSKTKKLECDRIILTLSNKIKIEQTRLMLYDEITRPIYYYDQYSVMFYLKRIIKQQLILLKGYPNAIELQYELHQLLKLKNEITQYNLDKKNTIKEKDEETENLLIDIRKGLSGKIQINE